MTHQEKAKELIEIFGEELALICVDEIINFSHCTYTMSEYYKKVKQEINNL